MPTTTGKASELLTFSRTSNATLTDSDGKIKWAPHNLLLASEQFDNAAWSKTAITVTANASAAPDGTTTADKLIQTAVSGAHFVTQNVSASGTITRTLYAKADGYNFVGLTFDNSTPKGAIFNLSTGDRTNIGASVTATSATNVGNNWWLLSMTVNGSVGFVQDYVLQTAGFASETGNGTAGILFWGASLTRSDLGGMKANTSAYPMYNPTTPKNLLGYTQSFDNAYWLKYSVAVPATKYADPYGGTTANLLYPTAAVPAPGLYKGGFPSVSKTHSYFVKAAGKTWFCVLKETTGAGAAWFNLSTGLVGTVAAGYTAPNPESLGNGWYRCSVTSTSGFDQYTAVTPVDADNSIIPTPNGTDGVYIWGAQLSDSASLDPYVPNYGAAPTAAAYYGPRLDYDPVTLAAKGLLVEELRANLVLYSAQFDVSANWVPSAGVSVSANTDISPDGTLTADTMNSSAGNQIDQSVSCSTSTVYTDSLYFKKTSGAAYQPALYLLFSGGTLVIYAVRLNTDTGVATAVSAGGFTAPSSFAVQDAGGYWRLSVTGNSNNNTTASFRLYPNLSSAGGVAGAGSQIIWGAQLEAGSFPTSYIPTGAATATRNADVASVSTQAFPYGATEGTLVVNGSVLSTAAGNRSIATLYESSNTAITTGNNVAGFGATTADFYVINSGSDQAVFYFNSAVTAGTPFKVGGFYKANNFNGAVNGTAGTLDTSGSVPSGITEMRLGRTQASSVAYLNGHIRQITYLPRAVTTAELQTRTT